MASGAAIVAQDSDNNVEHLVPGSAEQLETEMTKTAEIVSAKSELGFVGVNTIDIESRGGRRSYPNHVPVGKSAPTIWAFV